MAAWHARSKLMRRPSLCFEREKRESGEEEEEMKEKRRIGLGLKKAGPYKGLIVWLRLIAEKQRSRF